MLVSGAAWVAGENVVQIWVRVVTTLWSICPMNSEAKNFERGAGAVQTNQSEAMRETNLLQTQARTNFWKCCVIFVSIVATSVAGLWQCGGQTRPTCQQRVVSSAHSQCRCAAVEVRKNEGSVVDRHAVCSRIQV